MMSIHDLIGWYFFGSFFCVAISTLIFMRVCLKNIDGRMFGAGLPRPWDWGRTGLRAGFSAFILVLPLNPHEGQIDPYTSLRTMKPFATPKDRWVARVMIASEVSFIFAGILVSYYGLGGDS